MNIDMNLALTITAGILLAGLIKHVIIVAVNHVFGYGVTRKSNVESGSIDTGSKSLASQ